MRGWQGFQQWEEECGEGVGGVCRDKGSYKGMQVVVYVQLCQFEEMLPLPSSCQALLSVKVPRFTDVQS